MILDKSLKKLGFRYKNIKLENGNHLNTMQAIGKPISLGYNLKVIHLSLIIELYNFCNVRMKKNLKSNILSFAYEHLKNEDIEGALELIIQNAIEVYADKKGANVFANDLESKKLELLSKEELYEEDSEFFFSRLEKLKRPLLGVLKEDTIEVIKFEHLNLRGEPAVDFKRIEHNSPLEAEPFSLLGLAKTTVEAVMSYKLGKEQIKTEREKQKTEKLLQEYLRESIINDRRKTDAIVVSIKQKSNMLDHEISTKEAIGLIPSSDLRRRAANAYGSQVNNMAIFGKNIM